MYVLNLVLLEVRYLADDDPREGTSEVHQLMHNKGHDAGGNHIILHVGIPGRPHALQVVQMNIVLGDLLELAPVSCWEGPEGERSRVPAVDHLAIALKSRNGERTWRLQLQAKWDWEDVAIQEG